MRNSPKNSGEIWFLISAEWNQFAFWTGLDENGQTIWVQWMWTPLNHMFGSLVHFHAYSKVGYIILTVFHILRVCFCKTHDKYAITSIHFHISFKFRVREKNKLWNLSDVLWECRPWCKMRKKWPKIPRYTLSFFAFCEHFPIFYDKCITGLRSAIHISHFASVFTKHPTEYNTRIMHFLHFTLISCFINAESK